MTQELPRGWAEVNLSDVAERITKGSTPTSYGFAFQKEGISFIKIENLKNGCVDHSSIRHFISEQANQSQQRSILQEGDILFSIAGTIGQSCLIRKENLPANTNQALAIIRGTSQVFFPNFLRMQLESGVGRKQAREMERGGGMHNISLEDVGGLEMVVAPLAEQQRIVAKLEVLLGKVDACRNRLEKIPVILKRFRQSVLAAACSGRLTADWRGENPNEEKITVKVEAIRRQRVASARTAAQEEKLHEIFSRIEENNEDELPGYWGYVSLGKLCTSFDYGTSAKSQPSGSFPVLRMGNIQNGKIDWTDLVYTSDCEEIQKYSLKPNTVLFNRTNSPELVGKTAIYRGEQPAIFAGYLIRANPLPDLDPEYLNLCLNTNIAREFCSRIRTDGVSQSNINAQKLGTFEVPFCPIPEQQEIVRRVEALFAIADQIETRYAKARSHVDRLTQSILAKAFRGDLVPQDPNDEPAAVLLERIRSQRQGSGVESSQPRRKGGTAACTAGIR